MCSVHQLIEPYGDASQNDRTDQKLNLKQQGSSERIGTMLMNSNMRSRSPDYGTKDIYVDCKFFVSPFPWDC